VSESLGPLKLLRAALLIMYIGVALLLAWALLQPRLPIWFKGALFVLLSSFASFSSYRTHSVTALGVRRGP
jgi:hypothetical protein